MSTHATYELSCDDCGTAFQAPFNATGTAWTIRDAARNEGWQIIGGRGRVAKDYCPKCRRDRGAS